MNCDKISEIILSNGTSDAEEYKAHIASCAKCRNLASTWNHLKDCYGKSELPVPPKSADRLIIAEAAACLAKRNKKRKIRFRGLIAFAAAACFVLGVSVVFMNFRMPFVGTTASLNTDGKKTIAWSSVDMGDELFEMSVELELNRMLICSGTPENGDDSVFNIEFEIPDFII